MRTTRFYEDSRLGFFSFLARAIAEDPQGSKQRAVEYLPLVKDAEKNAQDDLFAPAPPPAGESLIPADHDEAGMLSSKLASVAPEAHQVLEYAWRSGRRIEAEALSFARLTLSGASPLLLRDESRPEVRSLRLAWRAVLKEIDRYLGILRFERAPDGCWEAECEPAAQILDCLVPHFEARFGGEAFRIIDRKRDQAVSGGEREAEAEGVEARRLWKLYYRIIENETRRNEALREQFIPRRYWKYLPELQEAPDRCPPGHSPGALPR